MPNVNEHYELRQDLASSARALQKAGYDLIDLNVGNPGAFGFRVPEAMRLALIENLQHSDGYCEPAGIFPAREAVAVQQQERQVAGVTADQVMIGTGVSELIDLTLRALIDTGDEILIPRPDYPLWTAAVELNGGVAMYYDCLPENGYLPDPEQIAELITPNTRGIVLINPNNPTGAVYPESLLRSIVAVAEEHGLILFSDEIYDGIVYGGAEFTPLAPLVNDTMCLTFGGVSKVYRAAGYRVGWLVWSGDIAPHERYLKTIGMLASLRLCSNVPAQWTVQSALGGTQSIGTLTGPGGRLYESREVVLEAIAKSPYYQLEAPNGAIYAFINVADEFGPFNDEDFARHTLQTQHILITPGSAFSLQESRSFRITFLPEARTMETVMTRLSDSLQSYRESL
ncbi:MAG: aminotransferase class I/II-fold pyridoxal phosphate-dependent enzyme [Acidimicrobiales bacterium]